MRKKVTGLFLAGLLVLLLAVPAYADDIQGASGWTVNFDGTKLDSNFTSSDMTEYVSGLQPGDSVTFTMALRNTSGKSADWWMTNQVLNSFEDASVANGGAYTYVLTYINAAGTPNEIYSSNAVGGESTAGGVGLHRATIGMEEFFYLDSVANGSGGTLTLQVALDGETQGNNYQNTLAELAMRFAVEPTAENPQNPQTPSNPGNPTEPPKTPEQTKLVKTGDDAPVVPYLILAGVSGALLMALAVLSLKRSRRDTGKGVA